MRSPRGLRVGYVNVRGLSRASWKACLELLNSRLDFLFVAETWFVNHAMYANSRYFVASTPSPRRSNPLCPGRRRGGVYLLATGAMRAMATVDGVTEWSVTFTACGETISGVYYPPTTMRDDALTRLLDGLPKSAVVVGDVNTRFRIPPYQSGDVGPPGRLAVFTSFLSRAALIHLMPCDLALRLTTDHCFARSGLDATLRLLDNKVLGMDTDHSYTVMLQIVPLALGKLADDTLRSTRAPRFKVWRLLDPKMAEKVRVEAMRSKRPYLPRDNVDDMNTKLVDLYRQIQSSTLGPMATWSTPTQNLGLKPRRPDPEATYPTVESSLRLYRHACRASRENEPIRATADAATKGLDAMAENLDVLRRRWAGPCFKNTRPTTPSSPDSGSILPWTLDDLLAELRLQDGGKACGVDGVHIRFLKATSTTPLADYLLGLYNTCLATLTTPRAWNRSEVYLLSKDVTLARDADNLRPISVGSVIRKVFERLLLRRLEGQTWATLQPTQAGFRRHYSTYSNVAVVHGLLSTRARSVAIFLDFRSAFDVVDPVLLFDKLARRGCPSTLISFLSGLMFKGVESRVLVNGGVSPWFPRNRGVLQGSPLSPWLFNLFVDDLLALANEGCGDLPACLFYADDGVLLASDVAEATRLLCIVERWSTLNRLYLNPTKCAVVAPSALGPVALSVGDQTIRQVSSYTYLGFPITSRGVDFRIYLDDRLDAAIRRARWLGLQSNTWGPVTRLHVYRIFLAPMFEYGAPLLASWARENPSNLDIYTKVGPKVDELISWVANTSPSRSKMTANIFGLTSLKARFERLRTLYQFVLDRTPPSSPLYLTLRNISSEFTSHLLQDPSYDDFRKRGDFEPTLKVALARHLRTVFRETIRQEARGAHLTTLIPMKSRGVPGHVGADICLGITGVEAQSRLLQYRRGMFMNNCLCCCQDKVPFRRGHETCPSLDYGITLTRKQKREKEEMSRDLKLGTRKFTDLDFLLNKGHVQEVDVALAKIQGLIRQAWGEGQVDL